MFDIVSYIREKILRRPKLTQEIPWEELSEKQTTKLWYFLLYCMFWAILVSAQRTLSIIKDIPSQPTSIPNCVYNMIHVFWNENTYHNQYYYNYGYNDCGLISQHPQFDFSLEYSNLAQPYKEINDLKYTESQLLNQKYTIENTQRNNQQDYNTSLTEKIAQENSWLYDKEGIQNTIKQSRLELESIDWQVKTIQSQIQEIQSQYKKEISAIQSKLIQAESDYKTSFLLYKLYVALLSFLFAISVFVVLYKIYVRQKIKNSPHTIIFSVATFAYWLVVLQISVLFIWDILPHKLLEIIMNLLNLFTPLVFLVQFLWPILIIAIFWFLVYKIQKRLYSQSNILKRFISDKKCPHCWNSVDFTKPFCPLCSHEIQIHCPECNELTVKWMPYCSSCGKKI